MCFFCKHVFRHQSESKAQRSICVSQQFSFILLCAVYVDLSCKIVFVGMLYYVALYPSILQVLIPPLFHLLIYDTCVLLVHGLMRMLYYVDTIYLQYISKLCSNNLQRESGTKQYMSYFKSNKCGLQFQYGNEKQFSNGSVHDEIHSLFFSSAMYSF